MGFAGGQGQVALRRCRRKQGYARPQKQRQQEQLNAVNQIQPQKLPNQLPAADQLEVFIL